MDSLLSGLNNKIDELNEEVQKLSGQPKVSNERISILEAENRRLNDKVNKLEVEPDKQHGQSSLN